MGVVSPVLELLAKNTMIATEEAHLDQRAGRRSEDGRSDGALRRIPRSHGGGQPHAGRSTGHSVRTTMILGLVAALVICTTAGILISGRIAHQVGGLLHVLQLAQHERDLTIPVPHGGNDEIATLAGSIEDLISSLRDHRRGRWVTNRILPSFPLLNSLILFSALG